MSDAPSTEAKQIPFAQALAKLRIGSLDEPTLQVEAHYNPKELQVDKAVPWSKANQTNKSNGKGIHLEFTGAEGRTMSVEMLFDGYETRGQVDKSTVKDQIAKLERMASVREEDPDEDKRRPHRCVVAWSADIDSSNGLPRFECVIESISTKYTMFSYDGVPLRATCNVKLKEANVVSIGKDASGGKAKKKPPAKAPKT